MKGHDELWKFITKNKEQLSSRTCNIDDGDKLRR